TNSYKKSGFGFIGWSDTPSGPVKHNNSGTIIINSNTTLYAVWAEVTIYSISFDGNGAISGSMLDVECIENESCQLPENKFYKTDYTFAGWSETKNGEVKYRNSSNVVIHSNMTLFAIWDILDEIPPTIVFTPQKELNTGTNVYPTSVLIKVSATDNLSEIKTVKYCTSINSSCLPTITIDNDSSINLQGRTGTILNNTICALAIDAADNTSSVVCNQYKVDSENPNLTCTSGERWSNNRSLVECSSSDNVGIRKLEVSTDNINWSEFSTINPLGPFERNYTKSFYATMYHNYIKVTDAPGLTFIDNNVFAKIDKTPPIAAVIDIAASLAHHENISSIECTNNELLPNGDNNSNYNKYANNSCTINTKDPDVDWGVVWYWPDDWAYDDGYSGVDYLTYSGDCSSNRYNGGTIPCLTSQSENSVNIYSVDKARNKSLYYLKLTIN
ncbi:MAG: InlB B-repeat-containing protein, partial [Bacilli bacterium]|nr:InlB B-repeat-containing protein [Bacilli bacterium]